MNVLGQTVQKLLREQTDGRTDRRRYRLLYPHAFRRGIKRTNHCIVGPLPSPVPPTGYRLLTENLLHHSPLRYYYCEVFYTNNPGNKGEELLWEHNTNDDCNVRQDRSRDGNWFYTLPGWPQWITGTGKIQRFTVGKPADWVEVPRVNVSYITLKLILMNIDFGT